jgi:hypothetical protein
LSFDVIGVASLRVVDDVILPRPARFPRPPGTGNRGRGATARSI